MKKQLVIAAGVLGALGLAAAPAVAKDIDVKGVATCTGGVKAKIKAGPRDPGQLKINIQIDDIGATARTWAITVADADETRSATRTTGGVSNSIDVDVFTADGAGVESVTFSAARDGASCTGSVSV